MTPREIRVVSRESVDHYTWGSQCDGWHLMKTPELSVIQERMPPNTAEVRHFHRMAQQFFFILSGEARMEVCGQDMILRAGQGISIPIDTPHQMRNASADDVNFLVISQPPSHGDREVVSGNHGS